MSKIIPNSEHVARYVKPSGLLEDGEGNVIGVHASAFELRTQENYLSINSMEATGKTSQLDQLKTIKGYWKLKNLKNTEAYATVGNVGKIKEAFKPASINISHQPSPQDPTYSKLEDMPIDRVVALEKLARLAWNDLIPIKEIK